MKKIMAFMLIFWYQHPSVHGVLRLFLELVCKIIIKADPHIGLYVLNLIVNSHSQLHAHFLSPSLVESEWFMFMFNCKEYSIAYRKMFNWLNFSAEILNTVVSFLFVWVVLTCLFFVVVYIKKSFALYFLRLISKMYKVFISICFYIRISGSTLLCIIAANLVISGALTYNKIQINSGGTMRTVRYSGARLYHTNMREKNGRSVITNDRRKKKIVPMWGHFIVT